MAQWIARWTSDPEVVGSSPTVIDFSFFCSFIPFSESSILVILKFVIRTINVPTI